jgi:hypothetical protein
MVSARLVLLAPVLATGCMVIPERYHRQQQTYPPHIERVALAGFNREAFRQTSGAGEYAIWGGQASASANMAGPDIAGSASGSKTWGGSMGAQSWSGEYRPVSDLPAFKNFLENTRCIKVVEAGRPEPDGEALTLAGDTFAEKHTGFWLALSNAPQVLTFVSIFGVPLHEAADATARVRLYQGERFVRELSATTRLRFWTTIYTFHADEPAAVEVVRQMALRDLADVVAEDFCRTAGP